MTDKPTLEKAAWEYFKNISPIERITHTLPDDPIDQGSVDFWIPTKGFKAGALKLLSMAEDWVKKDYISQEGEIGCHGTYNSCRSCDLIDYLKEYCEGK